VDSLVINIYLPALPLTPKEEIYLHYKNDQINSSGVNEP